MPTLPLEDGALYYELHGQSGPRVLFVPGMGARLSSWRHQVAALSSDHQVLLFDHGGVGQSEALPARRRIRDMAEDVRCLLDGVGWDDAHVVGVSMGGMVSQELALRHRARVRSLSLMATHMGGLLAWVLPMRGRHMLMDLVLRRPERRLRTLARLIYTPRYLEERGHDAVCTELANRFGQSLPVRTMLAQFAAVGRFRAARRLAMLADLPALVIQPSGDSLCRPAHSHRLHRRLPLSRLLALHAGHAVQDHAAEQVNRALRAFIGELEAD